MLSSPTAGAQVGDGHGHVNNGTQRGRDLNAPIRAV